VAGASRRVSYFFQIGKIQDMGETPIQQVSICVHMILSMAKCISSAPSSEAGGENEF
jgi:hypothetical protein